MLAEYGEFGRYGVVSLNRPVVPSVPKTSSVETWMKAKAAPPPGVELPPVAQGRFQQDESPYDVRADERYRAVDGTIDMGFGGEMQHKVGVMNPEQALDRSFIRNICFFKDIAGIVRHRYDRIQVAA